MSTQNPSAPNIPFSLTTPQQAFRLLELPAELLELISTPNALPLRLTSAPTLEHDDVKGRESLFVCGAEKTWAVRQVSTSNCVYITQMVGAHGNDGGGGAVDAATDLDAALSGQDGGGMTAISQVGSVLELIPVQRSIEEVEAHVRELVSIYESSTEPIHKGRRTTIAELANDIAAPTALILEACERLCVFEIQGQAYMPSKAALLDVWRKLVEGAMIAGIRLDAPFSATNVVRQMMAADEDEDMYGSGSAAVSGIVPEADAYCTIASTLLSQTFPRHGLRDDTLASQTQSAESQILLRPHHTADYLGALLLQTQPQSQSSSLATFLSTWHALVPEKWWSLCDPSSLPGCVVETDDAGSQAVRRLDPTLASAQTIGHGNGTEGAVAAAAAPAKKMGKWHEKFAAQRNAARELSKR